MTFKAKKIALFGTSADPPTNGHKKIIEELSKIFSLVISYASDNPSKEHQESLTFRSLLLKSLIDELKNPNVFFDQDLSSPWAIKTIKKCKLKYNTENIKFVIGSDLIEQIISWKNFNEIIKECDLFIIPREGYLINRKILKQIEENKGRYIISSFKVPNISSSMIREKNLQLELPKSIVEIIKHKNLYKNLE